MQMPRPHPDQISGDQTVWGVATNLTIARDLTIESHGPPFSHRRDLHAHESTQLPVVFDCRLKPIKANPRARCEP
eukprot:CAMPEP_0181168854 /NCGR_PEP_ID=MMETSP1096-20121128/499_1 /TAXON_ID=156174 ORGANISM="Chrysochromulina ericina, Strain CCMP281" /NCGR_SAMPLE_ID=MMETSP1096 /ASSEMBLY_ACC=CAM_ASM_000453 /LENGTH=74 /DNA_ID=CAMNT_0023256265 /DNA_START=168 /DNA_END=392 /DNA_ORIENTATION=-